MDVGLLLIRLVVGLLLVGHGTQKLFGWFGGHGLVGTGGFLETLGYRPGKPMAFVAGATEAVGGLLLAIGLLTPLAGAALVGVMLNAILGAHRGKGPWAQSGGWELAFTYGAVGATLAFTGPGRFSLDRAFDWNLAGNEWGAFALAVGVVSGAAALAARAASGAGSRQAA